MDLNSFEHSVCLNIVQQLSLINHYFMLLVCQHFWNLFYELFPWFVLSSDNFCCGCVACAVCLVALSSRRLWQKEKNLIEKKTGVVVMQRQNEIHLPSIIYSSKRQDPFSMNIQEEFLFLNQKPYSISTKNWLWNCKLNYENTTDTTLNFQRIHS